MNLNVSEQKNEIERGDQVKRRIVSEGPLTNLSPMVRCSNEQKSPPPDKLSSNVTETTYSVTESTCSSAASYNDHTELIRSTVKRHLDDVTDADKIKTISTKGRSIKFPVKVCWLRKRTFFSVSSTDP